MKMRHFLLAVFGLFLGLTLVGCGGGSSSQSSSIPVVYSSTVDDANGEIYLIKLSGTGVSTPIRLTNDAKADFSPAISADGRSVAYVETDAAGNDNIWIVKLDAEGNAVSSSRQKITDDTRVNETPALSWDGSSLIFVRQGQGIYQKILGNIIPISDFSSAANPSFSPVNSSLLAYSKRSQTNGVSNIFILNNGTNTEIQVTTGLTGVDYEINGLSWSPDGTKLVFGRISNGPGNLYVVNAAANSKPLAITSADDNGGPLWIEKNRIIFFSDKGVTGARHALFSISPAGGAKTLLFDDNGDISRRE